MLIGGGVWEGLAPAPLQAQIAPGQVRQGGGLGVDGTLTTSGEKQKASSLHRGVSARLRREPVYQGLAQKIETLRSREPKHESGQSPDIGDRESFYVRDVLDLSNWNEVDAELLAQSVEVQFWMEVGEADALRTQGLLQSVIDSLALRTLHRTPVNSVDPSRGILPIVHQYIGAPPDVDGDGRVDILLLDIEDQFEQTGSFVAGFFDPNDLTTDAYSNRRDLLYIDTRPTLLRGNRAEEVHSTQALSTIAHEYQHLIHANYEGEVRERTFVNEGLSEYTEILCGFSPRTASPYLEAPNRPLMSWNYADPVPDYARASLFMHYFFERIGHDWVDDLVKTEPIGIEGLQAVLRDVGGLSFYALFREWGRALFLSDRSVDSVYGYRHPERREVQFEGITSITSVPGMKEAELGALSHVPMEIPLTERMSLQEQSSGSIVYDANIQYPGAPDRFVSDISNGQDVSAEREGHPSMQVLVTNTSRHPDTARAVTQLLLDGERAAQRRTLQYDDGAPDAFSGNASYFLLEKPGEAIALTFGSSSELWLYGAAVDVVFRSELVGTDVPSDAPRRVTLQVHALEDGRPGAALTPPVTQTVERSFGNLKLEPISLVDHYESLSALQDSFVLVLESADSSNPLAVGMDRTGDTEAAGSAFHRTNEGGAWTYVQDVRAEGRQLAGYRPLIRAQTAVPEQRGGSSSLEIDTAHDREAAYVRLRAPFPLDSTGTQIVGRLPSGGIVEGEWTEEEPFGRPLRARTSSEVVFVFPPGSGADYELYARAESRNQTIARRQFTWRIPNEAAVQAGSPHPNPTIEDVKVPLTVLDPSHVEVTIYDVLGRVVHKQESRSLGAGEHHLELDLQELSSGMYFARINTRRERDGYVDAVTRKIVRLR